MNIPPVGRSRRSIGTYDYRLVVGHACHQHQVRDDGAA